jgi:hypothetical protein
MSKTEKQILLGITRRRYAMMRTSKAKGRILDEFCEVTGLSRKHVIAMLSPKKRPSCRRGCPSGGSREGTALLVKLWKLSDMLCGKLLKPVIGLYLQSMKKRDVIPVELCEEVLKMSPATIDRRLRVIKVRCGGNKRRRHDSLSIHRKEIPLKIDTWPNSYPKAPGWIEADTVAHCGGSMSGSFIWTLTMTDVGTGWTCLDSVWNKGAVGVRDAIDTFIREAPFTVRAFNSDNGGEFLNAHLKAFFLPLSGSIKRSRSRSYKKNDNAHVEQKNGVLVRGLFGHGRIDDPDLLPLMKRIDKTQCLIKNLFTPTMRLLSKERIGGKYSKQYEKEPKTPAQRLLESVAVSDQNKTALRKLVEDNDILALREKINSDLRLLAKKLNSPAEASGNTLQHRQESLQQQTLLPTPAVSSHLRQPNTVYVKVS